jgi:hypothetical protein
MSMPVIRSEVALMLADADQKFALAEADLAKGDARKKVKAAGELTFLKRQKEELEQRLKEIDASPAASETLFQWIKEEVFNLTLRLESWIAGG